MTKQTGPCDWPLLFCSGENQSSCDTRALDSLSPDLREAIETAAVEFLWNNTGRQYGLCETSIRPCRKECRDRLLADPIYDNGFFTPVLRGGVWHNISCGEKSCGDPCSCSEVCEVVLPGPVHAVTEVLLDGAVVDPSTYRVDNHRRLVRTGGGCWPTCQEMAQPSSETGTWEVTYLTGVPVPVGGQLAAGVLAEQIAKRFCGHDDCGLPERFSSVTRQGVTVAAFVDSFDDLAKGGTGLWIVDSWVQSVTAPRRRPRVLSPDLPRHRHTHGA